MDLRLRTHIHTCSVFTLHGRSSAAGHGAHPPHIPDSRLDVLVSVFSDHITQQRLGVDSHPKTIQRAQGLVCYSHQNTAELGGLNNGGLFFHRFGGWKSKIKWFLPGCLLQTLSLLCLPRVFLCAHKTLLSLCVSQSLLTKMPVRSGPTLTASL